MPYNFPGIFPPGRELQFTYDLATATSANGYVTFDGFNAKDSTGDNYVLLNSSIARTCTVAADDTPTVTTKTGNSAQSTDIDFDLSAFQIPRTIEGEAFMRLTIRSSSANQIDGVVATGKIRKWDGTTETEIATASTDTFVIPTATEESRTIQITVPKTTFKKGDQLRLTLQIVTTDNEQYKIQHNPNDNTGADTGKFRFALAVPFKIEV